MILTSDQVRGLTEDLCGRHVHVDHLLSKSLEHVTVMSTLNVACLSYCFGGMSPWEFVWSL